MFRLRKYKIFCLLILVAVVLILNSLPETKLRVKKEEVPFEFVQDRLGEGESYETYGDDDHRHPPFKNNYSIAILLLSEFTEESGLITEVGGVKQLYKRVNSTRDAMHCCNLDLEWFKLGDFVFCIADILQRRIVDSWLMEATKYFVRTLESKDSYLIVGKDELDYFNTKTIIIGDSYNYHRLFIGGSAAMMKHICTSFDFNDFRWTFARKPPSVSLYSILTHSQSIKLLHSMEVTKSNLKLRSSIVKRLEVIYFTKMKRDFELAGQNVAKVL